MLGQVPFWFVLTRCLHWWLKIIIKRLLSLATKSLSVWTASVVQGGQLHVPSEPILVFGYGLTNSFVHIVMLFQAWYWPWKCFMLNGRCSTDLSGWSKTPKNFLIIWQLQFRGFFFRIARWMKGFLSQIKLGLPWPVSVRHIFVLLSSFSLSCSSILLATSPFDHQLSLSCFLPCQLSHRSASISWKIKWSVSPFSCSFWV